MTGLKFSERKDGTLEVRGLGIPFGGPINGKDLHGQFFSAKTDFAWDLIPDGARPLLYQHGLDDTVKTEVVGRWGVEKVDSKGVWVRAQLSARSSYLNEIKELLTEDALGLSSATMGHLVKVNQKNGEILTWPVVELSLTPNPANPTAYVVKSMVTPARHAAKLLRVLKHGDHDQADHGNRDGGGGSDGSEEPRGNGMGGTSRGAQRAMGLAERAVSISKGLQEKVRSSETSATPAHREVARHLSRVAQLLGTASRTTELSSRSEARGNIREANLALFDAAFAINNLPDSERGEFFDTLRSIQVLQSDMREFTMNDEMFKSLKHGDHDQADHGNRDGASGGGSDGGDKPSGGSDKPSGSRSFSTARSYAEGNVRSIAEDVDKLRSDRTIDPAVRDKIGTLQDLIKRMSGEINDADPATDKNMITRGVLSTLGKMHGQVGDIVESLQDDWVFDDLMPLLDELDKELESFAEAFNSSAKKSWGRKHGDHDQADHGNRDGGGGSVSGGDKPSISRDSKPSDKLPAGSVPKVTPRGNGNRSLPWRGRTFDPSGYPPGAMRESREYAKEALAKIEEHIKPIDPSDDDDVRFAHGEKSALTSSITVAMDQLKEGNVGAALSNLARASARASRNDEAKELTDALDFLYDRTAASFGLDDVVNPDNLGRFRDIRESAREHFRDLIKNPGRGRRSFKAELYDENILEDDAEEGALEEEANEESDTLEASLAKLVESTEYTLGEIAEALAKATDENNEVIVNCLTESQDALEKLAGELATYLEGTSPTDEVEDETETETLLASPVASLAILAGKRSRAEEDLAAVKAALKAEIRKQTLVAIGRTRDRK